MATGTPAPAVAAPRRTPPLLAAVLLVVSLAYPVVVYLALGHVSPRWIALLLVALALARAWVTRESFWLVAAALAGVLAVAGALGDQWGPLKLYPALVNLVMFGLFFVCVYLQSSLTCEERERGVLLAQALSPASPAEILAAKFLFYPVIALALAVVAAGTYKPAVLALATLLPMTSRLRAAAFNPLKPC